MKKIEKLTEDQKIELQNTYDKWLAIGRNTEPLDIPRAKAAITNMYAAIGKPAPIFMTFSSPKMAMLAIALMRIMFKGDPQLGSQLEDQLWDQLRGQLRGQLGSQLMDQLRGQLGSQFESQLRSQLGNQLGNQLGSQLGNQLWEQLSDQLRSQLWGQFESQLEDQLWGQLRGQLRSQLRNQLNDQLWEQLSDQLGNQLKNEFNWSYFGGQHWCAWEVFYDFGNKIGVKYTDEQRTKLDMWLEQAKSCHWWWPMNGVCVLSERYNVLNIDEQSRLHSENGPACAYQDGFAVYAWHGVRVPKEWITDKSSLTPKIALTWGNVEQRRAACEILGWHNVLESPELNPKIIDEDEPYIGTLIEVDLPDAPAQWFLKYQCGTGRWFAESVNDKSFDTALKANAGGNGWRGVGDPMDFIPFVRS